MACCVLTAVVMHQLIKFCDTFDLHFFNIQYNEPEGHPPYVKEHGKAGEFETVRISIDGMTCAACIGAVEGALQNLKGLHRTSVSLPLGRATISYNPSALSTDRLLEAIREAGYTGTVGDKTAAEIIDRLRQTSELGALKKAITSAVLCLLLQSTLENIPSSIFGGRSLAYLTSLILAFKVQLWDAWSIHQQAWSGNGRKGGTMNTLLSLSLLLSIVLALLRYALDDSERVQSSITSGSLLTVVVLAGRYLDAALRRKSNSNLASLYVTQTGNDAYKLVHSDEILLASLLQKGDEVIVPVHAIIPCDCFIVNGHSLIDESTITGESLPVPRDMGDFLLAATRNMSHQLHVRICEVQARSSIGNVIEAVAASTEGQSQELGNLDTIMNIFVRGVILLAVASSLFTGMQNQETAWIERVLVACERGTMVLAAACPCGIGLAVPSATMAGIDAAFSQGVLVSGGMETMKALSKATHVVMDKTGTLTKGGLTVTSHRLEPSLEVGPSTAYQLLAAAEEEDARTHPVARAVFKWALHKMNELGLPQQALKTRNMTSILGKGVSCELKGPSHQWYSVATGTLIFLEEQGISGPVPQRDEDKDGSSVHFAINSCYGGYLRVQDVVRDEAPEVIKSLSKTGLTVTMLTGDTAKEAERISSALNISVLAARASPSDKKQFVEELQAQGHTVVMVGDGINDTLAQATADVGISVSLAQGCLAGAGNVIVMSNTLDSLTSLFSIAKEVVVQAQRNIWWGLLYNIAAVSIAMGVFEPIGIAINASIAGTMMAFSSISVLSMSLYLSHKLKRKPSKMKSR